MVVRPSRRNPSTPTPEPAVGVLAFMLCSGWCGRERVMSTRLRVIEHSSVVPAPGRSPMDLSSLRRAYRDGTASPSQVVEQLVTSIDRDRTPGIWICRRDAAELHAEARALEARHAGGPLPPLYGIPFGVKDSIDVAGVATTVACPGFAYVAEGSAPVVERLRAAGLVGVRSPYGVPPNPFDARYITGGSSSGSAAAVTRGHVSFAIATDTAGSGRVPAAFNNIVGLKPSLGLLSTTGLVPACRSVDCMTIMSLTCEDARTIASVAAGFDPNDAFSRPAASE